MYAQVKMVLFFYKIFCSFFNPAKIIQTVPKSLHLLGHVKHSNRPQWTLIVNRNKN